MPASVLIGLLLAAPPAIPEMGRGGRAKSFADVAEVTAEVVPAKAKPGEAVTFKLTVSPKPGCWTYPFQPPAGQVGKNEFEPLKDGPVRLPLSPADPSGAHTKPGLNPGEFDRYYPDPVTWEIKGTVAADAKPGTVTVALAGSVVQVCNDSNCFASPFKDPPSAAFEVLPGPPAPTASAAPVAPVETPKVAAPPAPPAGTKTRAPAEYAAALDDLRTRMEAQPPPETGTAGAWGLLATAVFWGFVSLATPCVFPMIPITVSLFLKQADGSVGRAVRLAAVYSGTIVAILGLSAFFLLNRFRAWSVSPEMNLLLGGLFVVFALSFLGLFDLALPGFLVRGAEARRKAGGYLGTVFGAVAFSLVSFTCVAPFLGGFAGLVSSGRYPDSSLALAAFGFAAAFASPFFVLALFPRLLKTLPRSGGWLDSVKAVMGFVELAAALKFFRTAELRLLDRPAYFTYDLVLAGWVVTAVVCGLYLLRAFRLPHDADARQPVGVVRLLVALLFLGFGAYLSPALFGHRPGGAVYAWVDAFLLPEPAEATNPDELPWTTDLPAAVARVQADKRRTGTADKPLLFVDFTGVTCTNCKLNEKDVFPRPAVRSLLQKYTLVSLYTDEVPAGLAATGASRLARKEEAAANLGFQRELFGTEQLPLYAVLDPQATGGVRVVGVYDEGKINDVPRFVEFLAGPLNR